MLRNACGLISQAFLICWKGAEGMRILADKSLAAYIRGLIRTDNVKLFYQTKEWKELRLEVLEENHFECAECIKKGKYTRADCVHHVNEVRVRPELALSKYYTDQDGQQQKQLVPLCNECHNIVHDKLGKWQQKDKFTNEERW